MHEPIPRAKIFKACLYKKKTYQVRYRSFQCLFWYLIETLLLCVLDYMYLKIIHGKLTSQGFFCIVYKAIALLCIPCY